MCLLLSQMSSNEQSPKNPKMKQKNRKSSAIMFSILIVITRHKDKLLKSLHITMQLSHFTAHKNSNFIGQFYQQSTFHLAFKNMYMSDLKCIHIRFFRYRHKMCNKKQIITFTFNNPVNNFYEFVCDIFLPRLICRRRT